ncbi:hypothetical protein BpHYR1_042486 [Brachionus plicatilis]|uniref:Uncharacterized protein n=1 Tax=Brachionus plicatilis TaxID=10195 RepID=A0A3M7SXC8_BRAPC|nr:hypothetical protein BpHYR1_042486 [Brachionus plicatilis]
MNNLDLSLPNVLPETLDNIEFPLVVILFGFSEIKFVPRFDALLLLNEIPLPNVDTALYSSKPSPPVITTVLYAEFDLSKLEFSNCSEFGLFICCCLDTSVLEINRTGPI